MSATMPACAEIISTVPTSIFTANHPPALKSQPPVSRSVSAPNFVHIRIDGFFAAVEQVLHRKFHGKPLFVGRDRVVAASYEAKLLGIRNGMSLAQGLAICPHAIVVAGNYNRYAGFAERVRGILESFTPDVESDAHHGFYLNFCGSQHLNENFPGTLRRLQLEIFQLTGLSVSIGAAQSKVLAAIASRLELPRGLRIIARGEEDAFLASLPVEAVDEINNIDAADLRKRGISTIIELRRVPLASLESAYGDAIGRQIWENVRGRDARQSVTPPHATACSREFVIHGGTTDPDELATLTNYLCERIAHALRYVPRQPRSINLRIRYFDQFSAAQSLRLPPVSDHRQLLAAAGALLKTLFTRPMPVQSLAISVATAASIANTSSPSVEQNLAAIA